MSEASLYPPSPQNVPSNLTRASASYKLHAWLAMLGLMLFMALYFSLMGFFAYVAYKGAMTIYLGQSDLWKMIISASSLLLTIFMLKSLLVVRRSGVPNGVEVSQEQEPRLYEFLHNLADEVGAPKPHRVFITPQVNAAVFYDLSIMNFIFPSRKNLIIGLGLVNVLNLGELKAVLAHEFGHFAQGSMKVGRWVYVAQQIISHMVATRSWLDTLVKKLSRIDIRFAWIGWTLALIIWSIRSIMDTLFDLVILAERALGREMEFNADLVAVSVTGSDALIHALYKLNAADDAWQTSLNIATKQANNGYVLEDLFAAQRATIEELGRILDDVDYGQVPELPMSNREQHRVFSERSARPPEMWSTHPDNRDREDNAKNNYIHGRIDEREAWVLFADSKELRHKVSLEFYNPDKLPELQMIEPADPVTRHFSKERYNTKYRGAYLNRSPVRNFPNVQEMLQGGEIATTAKESIAQLYPESIREILDAAWNLDIERRTLEGLQRGTLKPSGGIIRHRDREIKKGEIPEAIKQLVAEHKIIMEKLNHHDASARRAHLQLAQEYGNGWPEFLLSLNKLLHCSEHLHARVEDEDALFYNTWVVIMADGQIGYFEKRRMINVCRHLHKVMNEVSQAMEQMVLPKYQLDKLGIENWARQCPEFNLVAVDKNNWKDWCKAASDSIDDILYALNLLRNMAFDELIYCESFLRECMEENSPPQQAPDACVIPEVYPILLPGDENVLQRRLDLWNRFQLAHGFMPTLMRLLISMGIVGGTIYGGLTMI